MAEHAIFQKSIEALRRFMSDVQERGLENASERDLLLYRSADSLVTRLGMCLEFEQPLSAAMFSPADKWALSNLADRDPAQARAFVALRDLLPG